MAGDRCSRAVTHRPSGRGRPLRPRRHDRAGRRRSGPVPLQGHPLAGLGGAVHRRCCHGGGGARNRAVASGDGPAPRGPRRDPTAGRPGDRRATAAARRRRSRRRRPGHSRQPAGRGCHCGTLVARSRRLRGRRLERGRCRGGSRLGERSGASPGRAVQAGQLRREHRRIASLGRALPCGGGRRSDGPARHTPPLRGDVPVARGPAGQCNHVPGGDAAGRTAGHRLGAAGVSPGDGVRGLRCR